MNSSKIHANLKFKKKLKATMTHSDILVKMWYIEEERITKSDRGLVGHFTIKVKLNTRLKRIYEGVRKYLKNKFIDDPSTVILRILYKNTGITYTIPESGTLEYLMLHNLLDLGPDAAQEIQAFLPLTNGTRKKRKRESNNDGEKEKQKLSKQRKKSTLQPLSRDDIIAGKYKIQKKLGEGTFSVVYSALNIEKNFDQVALKIDKGSSVSSFEREVQILNRLKGEICYPQIQESFVDSKYGKIIVMERLGEPLRVRSREKISMTLAFEIIIQAFDRLEGLHDLGVIHRDVKPNNFIFGTDQNIFSENIVLYLIDFGLAKKFTHNNRVRKRRKNVGFRGSSKYVLSLSISLSISLSHTHTLTTTTTTTTDTLP